MFATRFAARAIPAFKQQAVVVRQMSGHSAEHAKKETETWMKATVGKFIPRDEYRDANGTGG